MKNGVQLICYADRISSKGLNELKLLFDAELSEIFTGIHLLPFFYPIDGADAGFDPIDHTYVDPSLGNWNDLKDISNSVDVMGDIIVNHMSAQSPEYLDFLQNGQQSIYSDLFLSFEDVFANGAKESDLIRIYRPRPGLPFTTVNLKGGVKKLMWTSFTSNQIDINVLSEPGKKYLNRILNKFEQAGISAIRLDAAGYAIKKAGTSCFMIPETFEFIDDFTQNAHSRGIEVLVEIHSYYKDQIEIARKVDYVYDFALPPLILHAIFNKTGKYLKKWLEISPRNCITVLDTHDGIGVIDIGPVGTQKEKPGLVPNEEIDKLVEQIHQNSRDESRKATGEAASNLDLYQVNCTYYDALAKNDHHYLLARAIQFFAPGIPQVYYMGFLAEPNDMNLLAKTGVGRDINRHYFMEGELQFALKRPVVKKLIKLIKLRNSHPAFQGQFKLSYNPPILIMIWEKEEAKIQLNIDFRTLNWEIIS